MDKNPLVVQVPNHIGDTLMCLPALRALDAAGFDLQIVGRAGWLKGLFAAMPWPVTRLQGGIRDQAKTLRSLKISYICLFTNGLSSAIAARLAGMKPIGYRAHGRSLLLYQGIKKIIQRHEVEQFWVVAKFAKDTLKPTAAWPATAYPTLGLQLPPEAKERAQTLLQQAGISNEYVVICPGATGTVNGQVKIWPYFAQLCQRYCEQGVPVISCTIQAELKHAQQSLPGATLFVGEALTTFAALMQQSHAQWVIANDSGPMHLAAAVGANVLGIFGVSPLWKAAPWGVGKTVGDGMHWPSLDEVWSQLQ